MAQIDVMIPDALKDWIDKQVQSGRYVDASDYLRDLVHRDRLADAALIDALEDAVSSGDSEKSLDEIWTSAKSKAGHG
jgi:antitoxin ParD1/3/4